MKKGPGMAHVKRRVAKAQTIFRWSTVRILFWTRIRQRWCRWWCRWCWASTCGRRLETWYKLQWPHISTGSASSLSIGTNNFDTTSFGQSTANQRHLANGWYRRNLANKTIFSLSGYLWWDKVPRFGSIFVHNLHLSKLCRYWEHYNS